MMSSLSAIILARNEEQHIVDCINSIQCANEISSHLMMVVQIEL